MSKKPARLPSKPLQGLREEPPKEDSANNLAASDAKADKKQKERTFARLRKGWICGSAPGHCNEDGANPSLDDKCDGRRCTHARCVRCWAVRIFLPEQKSLIEDSLGERQALGYDDTGWFHDTCGTWHQGMDSEKRCKACPEETVGKRFSYTCVI